MLRMPAHAAEHRILASMQQQGEAEPLASALQNSFNSIGKSGSVSFFSEVDTVVMVVAPALQIR